MDREVGPFTFYVNIKTSGAICSIMAILRHSTLVFLYKASVSGEIIELCLAMKKRGFGVNKWNGVGGKVEGDETLLTAAKREAREEIDVIIDDLKKMAELTFVFPAKPAWNQLVHVYFTQNWQGEPKESEEMVPKWFKITDIPYVNMWPDDIFWLPEVIKGRFVTGAFTLGEGDAILDKTLRIDK